MSYRWQWIAACVVAVASAVIGAIQLADAQTLGLSPRLVAWLSIVTPGLAVLASLLPRVTATPSDARAGLD